MKTTTTQKSVKRSYSLKLSENQKFTCNKMTSAAVKKYDELIRCTKILTEGIENEFSKFATHHEHSRKKWLACEEENHDMKKYIAKYTADKDTLEVKLKMARHQLDSEMKKRLKAEQSVDHMARQLELIKELLLDKDSGAHLSLADKQALAQSINQYSNASTFQHLRDEDTRGADLHNQSYTFDESSSFLSPSDYDKTEDDILDNTGGSVLGNNNRRKSHKRGRPSAPPLPADETTSDDTDYVKRTKVTEEVHKTIERHVEVSKSKSPGKSYTTTERLDSDFARPPPQNGRRPPSKQHLKDSASTSEISDYHDKENISTPRGMTKQTTVPNIYPDLHKLSTPDRKYNTLGTPKSRKELAHAFVTKTAVRMETCGPCGKRVRFGSSILKCKDCKSVAHVECKEHVPLPCHPTKDTPGSKKREGAIESYVNNSQQFKVPALVQSCIEEVEQRGLKELGIYRVPGMDKDVKELKEKFLRGKVPDLSKYRDIHVICGCLKDFLRGLSEPIVTYSLYESFMVAAGLSDDDDSLSAMYQCISELPQANRDTLASVVLHLQKVSQSPDTQMCIANLSKVFGPTLIGHRSANPTHMEMLEDTQTQPMVVARLIEMPTDYWVQFSTSNMMIHSAKTPPYNPTYFSATPKTPEYKAVPESLLGSLDPSNQRSNKKTYHAMTPKVVSKDRHKFFNSPS